MRPVLGVGWDVGGWRGRNQAVAVITQEADGLRQQGRACCFSLAEPVEELGSLAALIRRAWPAATDEALHRYRIVLAIDAPLGLPRAVRDVFFGGEHPVIEREQPEICNPLAYRETDRWVHDQFSKKPLSAAFDRLGNNASVARWHLNDWKQQGVHVAPPRPTDSDNPVAIEVYPALVKEPRSPACRPRFDALLRGVCPDGLDGILPGSHEHDATICAVHALCFALGHDEGPLPPLTDPPDCIPDATLAVEGWIYSIAPTWLGAEG